TNACRVCASISSQPTRTANGSRRSGHGSPPTSRWAPSKPPGSPAPTGRSQASSPPSTRRDRRRRRRWRRAVRRSRTGRTPWRPGARTTPQRSSRARPQRSTRRRSRNAGGEPKPRTVGSRRRPRIWRCACRLPSAAWSMHATGRELPPRRRSRARRPAQPRTRPRPRRPRDARPRRRGVGSREADLSADDHRQREVSEALEALRGRRGEVDLLLAERRMALEQLAERLAERYDLGIEALDEVEGRPADDDAARAEELRARLVRLGDVNPAALTELAEIPGRHEFLAPQRAELERSLPDPPE